MKATGLSFDLVCRCGATAFEAFGKPITVATCHCESCGIAARQFAQEFGAGPVIGADGGVDYALFRKDRVTLLRGRDNLMDHRLTTDSPTRRVVATCCNSPMFLDYAPGHWLSLFNSSLAGQALTPRLRAHTPRFLLTLLVTWARMGFRRPDVSF